MSAALSWLFAFLCADRHFFILDSSSLARIIAPWFVKHGPNTPNFPAYWPKHLQASVFRIWRIYYAAQQCRQWQKSRLDGYKNAGYWKLTAQRLQCGKAWHGWCPFYLWSRWLPMSLSTGHKLITKNHNFCMVFINTADRYVMVFMRSSKHLIL